MKAVLLTILFGLSSKIAIKSLLVILINRRRFVIKKMGNNKIKNNCADSEEAWLIFL